MTQKIYKLLCISIQTNHKKKFPNLFVVATLLKDNLKYFPLQLKINLLKKP